MDIDEQLNQVFEKAKQIEIDGKKLYEEEMAKTDDEGLKNILKMLAEAEQNHYDVIVGLQNDTVKEVKPTSLAKIKNVFEEYKKEGKSIITTTDHAEFYKKVQKLEEMSEKIYRDEANRATNPDIKKVLNDLADEEHRHEILMENFVAMCTNPKQWVEDAEFSHISEEF